MSLRTAPATSSVSELFRLDGRVALVTGASSGLGVALARAFAEAGADVSVVARRVERLEETRADVERAGRRAVVVEADVTSVDDCRRAVETTVAELGRLDVLLNNAGVSGAVPGTREPPEHFRHIVDVNLCGSYWMAQAAARAMTDGGSIVNLGSVLGSTTMGLPQAAYSASKAAIEGLTRDLAQQWTGRKGIRVNAIAPGIFPSEMTARYEPGYAEDLIERRIPAGRWGDPRELAATAVFLASDAAAYITGVVLPVDGGLLTT